MLTFKSVYTFIPRIYSQSIRTLVTCNQYQGKPLLAAINGNQNSLASTIKPEGVWSLDLIRTVIRNNFPYPKETKRVKVHGFKKRMSTRGGRAILMRRILKGRHVLSH